MSISVYWYTFFIYAHSIISAIEQSNANNQRETETERTFIREGWDFEQEYRLNAAEAGRFLIEIGEQFQEGNELTLTDQDWKLPCIFGEPIEPEIGFESYDDAKYRLESIQDIRGPINAVRYISSSRSWRNDQYSEVDYTIVRRVNM